MDGSECCTLVTTNPSGFGVIFFFLLLKTRFVNQSAIDMIFKNKGFSNKTGKVRIMNMTIP